MVRNPSSSLLLLATLPLLSLCGTAAAQPLDVLTAAWGAGADAVTRAPSNESAAIGPMSFALCPDGGAWILDQLQQRVVQLDAQGRMVRTVALPSTTYNGLAVRPSGHLVLLDRLVGRHLRVLDPNGRTLREVPIEGDGISEGGGVTALLDRPDGIWLEYDRTHSVQVLDATLEPCERRQVSGRPSALAGATLVAGLDGAGAVVVQRQGARLSLSDRDPIRRILWVEDDTAGRLLVVYETALWDSTGQQLVRHTVVGRWLDPNGKTLLRFESPYSLTEYEQYREIRLDTTQRPARVVQMAFTEAGLRLVAWRLP